MSYLYGTYPFNISVHVSFGLGPQIIKVLTSIVQCTCIPPTIKFTKERGYDMIPGDMVKVPIRFVMKVQNASINLFTSYIGIEVYIIGGEKKGYRAALYNMHGSNCTVAVHGQQHMSLKTCHVTTSVIPPPERIAPSRVDTKPLGSLSSTGWTFWSDIQAVNNMDIEDVIVAAALKLSEIPGPISWLKEFSVMFFTY
ncbi:hypothetical protein EDD22DRAFT_848520 [Suillus occidentalis]|nr:hypothetical protein EDD22DRAFT_848520 [Suillus occidentalis]